MLYQQTRPAFWRRHPAVTGAVALAATWWLVNGWYTAVTVAAIVTLTVVVARRRRELAIRDAGLRARAEYEHRLNLAGDPRGVFGRYPPLQPGWFPDPQNRCGLRYFDGAMWTHHTR
ncbi:Protein of unknown function [Mycolicibacterium rutilum]|uniref:DUF2510 domain-containing protein n=1 Tax=Mycolicibacterium rutilum TaxID=370526 RepID=A0A1H6JRY5_MYCRU|nr:DUF2510 domain-containing protein [Mycolicibacterium rutilum]SEH63344.1 Protein of unknown function [Mycolicibacterium rutilum]